MWEKISEKHKLLLDSRNAVSAHRHKNYGGKNETKKIISCVFLYKGGNNRMYVYNIYCMDVRGVGLMNS